MMTLIWYRKSNMLRELRSHFLILALFIILKVKYANIGWKFFGSTAHRPKNITRTAASFHTRK